MRKNVLFSRLLKCKKSLVDFFGLQAFFDFIVALNNIRLDQDNDTLKEILKTNIDKAIDMLVYSSKTQTVRKVSITPSTSWGGQGLLGVSIRFCSFQNAAENVWRILDVRTKIVLLYVLFKSEKCIEIL